MKYRNYRAIEFLTPGKQKWTELYNNEESTGGTYMSTQQQMEDQLWDYIDGLSSAAEKSEIEKLIDSNIEWQSKYRELLEIHQLMMQSDLEEPSMRFTKNVMEEISKYHVSPATKSYIDKKLIWGIGSFFLVMIAGFLIYMFTQVKFTGGGDGVASDVLNKYNPGKIDYSRFFNSSFVNIFIMINVVLGLMLLDMYLGRKKAKRNIAG